MTHAMNLDDPENFWDEPGVIALAEADALSGTNQNPFPGRSKLGRLYDRRRTRMALAKRIVDAARCRLTRGSTEALGATGYFLSWATGSMRYDVRWTTPAGHGYLKNATAEGVTRFLARRATWEELRCPSA